MEKQYLGNGVYMDLWKETKGLVLTTENGYEATNTIYLEPEVVIALVAYLERMVESPNQ